MTLRWSLRPNTYHDSVKLMRVSEALAEAAGVRRAAAVMATPLNLELLAADGLLPPDLHAKPDDLLVAVLAEEEMAAQAALARVDDLLAPARSPERTATPSPRTLEAAAGQANLAVIAVPGQYAAVEALAALHSDLHVFLFSDNVTVEDEICLKRLAAERDLLMMGPDCGTAILGGIGLGFANRVRTGPVGIVSASGTGLQQVCCLLDEHGVGIAQAIGTGGRDLSAPVGGLMTRRALHVLEADARVEVITLVSKPPDPGVAEALNRSLQRLSKPVIACLLGERADGNGRVLYTPTLTDSAAAILDRLGVRAETREEPRRGAPSHQRSGTVHGLFAGGTLCSEAALVLGSLGVPHQLTDLGGDQYTRGRAHPMIDPRLRASMLTDLSRRGGVGAVLIDVILGDLAHPDPAGALRPALEELRAGDVPVVAALIGTRADPQGLEAQRATLEGAGALVSSSNAAAARLAGALTGGTA